jgi:hypothetical protein
VTVNTISDLLGIGNPDVEETYRFAQETTDQAYISKSFGKEQYLTTYIRKSSYRETYTRTYDTLGTVLAIFTGYLNALLAVMGVLAIKMHQLQYEVNLANNLKKSQQIDEAKNTIETSITCPPSVKNSKPPMEYTIREIVKFTFCGFLKKVKKDCRATSWKDYQEKVIKNTDVRTLVNIIDEFERLKKMLLSREQLVLFDQISSEPLEESPETGKFEIAEDMQIIKIQNITMKAGDGLDAKALNETNIRTKFRDKQSKKEKPQLKAVSDNPEKPGIYSDPSSPTALVPNEEMIGKLIVPGGNIIPSKREYLADNGFNGV